MIKRIWGALALMLFLGGTLAVVLPADPAAAIGGRGGDATGGNGGGGGR